MMEQAPVLRRGARVSGEDGRVVIRHLDDEISLEGAGARLLSRMLPLLDGDNDVERIAIRVGQPVGLVRRLAERLREAGVLSFVGRGVTMTGLDFYDLHRRYVRYWLEDVYAHPFWDKITSGAATRAQVIGFAFEKYHYIEGAYEHMGIAAANASREMMPHLARHYIEEYNHGDIYRKGLQSLFPDDLILRAQPLPTTRALVNFLTETAQRSSFAYYAGNEVLQMTENTSDARVAGSIDQWYASMREHYPWSRLIVNSFIAHTHADQKLGHESVFREMCESIHPLTRVEVTDALNVAKQMVEHLVLFVDGIDIHYGRHPEVPRVPCDLLSE
jgi:pyrroloquinoline quinone (PQQ) biosynthesis protein C